MRTARFLSQALVAVLVIVTGCLTSGQSVFAHCDTFDGPVVTEARTALEAGDVTSVLKWVQPEHEAELKGAFESALAVRKQSPEAQKLADQYFFETLVRLHREGEGAPYTGLKPAGTVEPAVEAADKAVEAGSVDALAQKIAMAAEDAVRERYERLMAAKKHRNESVEAGREFVAAYVEYVHFVEGLHNTITKGGGHEHE